MYLLATQAQDYQFLICRLRISHHRLVIAIPIGQSHLAAGFCKSDIPRNLVMGSQFKFLINVIIVFQDDWILHLLYILFKSNMKIFLFFWRISGCSGARYSCNA